MVIHSTSEIDFLPGALNKIKSKPKFVQLNLKLPSHPTHNKQKELRPRHLVKPLSKSPSKVLNKPSA